MMAENENIIEEDDEVQVWDGDNYISVPQELDKTVILRGSERELVDIEEFFYDESFGQPIIPDNTGEIRQSRGFQERRHFSTESLNKWIKSLLYSEDEKGRVQIQN